METAQEKDIISIVIADDNIDFVNILRDYLSEKDGLRVIGTASNGLEAVDVITEKVPDVVILDIIMPHLDGLGVIEKLNSIRLSKKPQVIMLSAIGGLNVTKLSLSLGAEFFMVKPFDMDELVLRIRQLQLISRNIYHSKTVRESIAGSVKTVDSEINEVLCKIGVPVNLKGYTYLVHAVKMLVKDLNAINSISKTIYYDIAREYKTSVSRVERAIRNAIELTWSKGNIEFIEEFFGYDINKIRPSNSEFLIKVTSSIRTKRQFY